MRLNRSRQLTKQLIYSRRKRFAILTNSNWHDTFPTDVNRNLNFIQSLVVVVAPSAVNLIVPILPHLFKSTRKQKISHDAYDLHF